MSDTAPSQVPPNNAGAPAQEPVWTYRGYNLRSSEFTTAMVHYYRAEIQRSNTWRTRLDATTNWAVITTGAAITFALTSPDNHFGVIILSTLLVTLFLWIEARRYRYYELWSHRARLLETDFFAAMLVPPFAPRAEWGETLAESLLQPEFPISTWEAFGRRLRRNYLWIYAILALAWALKSFLFPFPATTFDEFLGRSAIGTISGWTVLVAGLLFNGALLIVAIATAGLQQASGEVLPEFSKFPPMGGITRMGRARTNKRSARTGLPPWRRRQQLLALIVTSKPQQVADCVLKEMRRGVTGLHGRGMYTQVEREVLMVALTVTETPQLKALVSREDDGAFVVITPAQTVLGRGFQPLAEDDIPA
jgi:uncharacterized membrane protein